MKVFLIKFACHIDSITNSSKLEDYLRNFDDSILVHCAGYSCVNSYFVCAKNSTHIMLQNIKGVEQVADITHTVPKLYNDIQ